MAAIGKADIYWKTKEVEKRKQAAEMGVSM
jgi:hypothetical protein